MVASLTRPDPDETATQAHALTGIERVTFGLWDHTQATEPHQRGQKIIFLFYKSMECSYCILKKFLAMNSPISYPDSHYENKDTWGLILNSVFMSSLFSGNIHISVQRYSLHHSFK